MQQYTVIIVLYNPCRQLSSDIILVSDPILKKQTKSFLQKLYHSFCTYLDFLYKGALVHFRMRDANAI